ncbi:MAG: T9SS type A sorting domain-containing protein, partial [Paramuribaculum sp.]|nr:T9SS type A sorting domain-containing protein [Paramuribaculum sp.]
NMELLLGEFGWYPSSSQIAEFDNITKRPTPQAPVITKALPLTYSNTGADIKVIWEMNHTKAAGEPVYNSDVNTSVFRMYAQQEGGEPINMGMTTTWAGICFRIPVDGNAASSRVRVGVSAVSEDYLSESDIAWSDYLTLPTYQGTDEITVDKPIIKAHQSFNLSFVDPLHESATWVIKNSETNAQVFSGNGTSVECTGLPATGLYNVEVSYGSKTDTYKNYLCVSPDETGTLPEIETMAINGTDTEDGPAQIKIELNDPRTFSYTGRSADGNASRGIEFQGNFLGVNVGTLGIQANQSFSIAAWVYYPEFNSGISSFITIENRATGGWPYDNWGFLWTRLNAEGKFLADQIDSAWGGRAVGNDTEGDRIFYRYDDTKIVPCTWTHVALVFEYKPGTNQYREMFYVNGQLQKVGVWIKVNKGKAEHVLGSEKGLWTQLERVKDLAIDGCYGENTYEPGYAASSYPLSANDWIAFGGTASNVSSLEGYIDDFQVWGTAMTASDVVASMSGLDPDNLPAGVLGFWDFESAPASDYGFVGKTGTSASNKAPKAYYWRLNGNNKVYTAPVFHAGSPQISGTYPIVTVPTWDAGRGATVTGSGNDTEGQAEIEWSKVGDYTVQLTLSNDHGSTSREYPVISVEDQSIAGIGSVEADGDFTTYVESDMIFVEFAQDGDYTVNVYNVSGIQLAEQHLSVSAGQNAQISIGAPGVYLVKVEKAGKAVRTVKVLVK